MQAGMRPDELGANRNPARDRAGGSVSVPRRFAIGDERTKDAGRTADAAAAVDQMKEIALAGRRAELAHDHDIAVAREAGAASLEVVAIDELAARAIEQDIVRNADRLGRA